MNEKKYVLTDETKVVNGITLHRIKYVKSFYIVKKGQLGGWIESEENLSHEGICYVLENSHVYGNARVCGDAKVHGNASVFGDAMVYGNARVCGDAKVYGNANVHGDALVCGNAKVYDDALVYGDALVCDDAQVYDDAEVYGNAKVFGHARVCNNVQVCGNVMICGNANITNNSDYLSVDNIGSRNDTTTFFTTKDNNIEVKCGCFRGTLNEFREKVKETHGDTKYAKEYLALADLAELRLSNKEDKENE